MTRLSISHDVVLAQLDRGKQAQARQEFARAFAPTVREMYGQVAQTYPSRFAKIDDWCSWARVLVTQTGKAEKALAGSDDVEAGKAVAALREHFYKLHRDTNTQTVSDLIYAFHVAAGKEQPAVAELRSLRSGLDQAPPSLKVRADTRTFARARASWAEKVDAILRDGRVDAGELATLRSATEKFYRAFGTQFE